MTDELRPPRKLRLWEALTLSVGLMGPTLAMALNGAGVAATVGKAVPLVFVLGLAGVALVAYGFVRLTRHFNHAGSVYALAGVTLGPKAGFFGGFALLGTYLFFTVCTLAATAVFAEAFFTALGLTWNVPWFLVTVVTAAGVWAVNSRESQVTARTLLAVEGVGILGMLVLSAVVVARTGTGGGPAGQRLDLSVFTLDGTTGGAVMTATVFAFLSWAGFEACASLGEETDDPRRNIPRALAGSVLLTGGLYVLVMFAQTIGFGTDAEGVKAFSGAESSLSALAESYIGTWFSLVIAFTAMASAFAATISSSAAASRLMFALARDGFGPRALSRTHPRTGAPTVALLVALTAGLIGDLVLNGSGVSAFDAYYWLATLGVLCLLVAYAVAASGVAAFIVSGRGQVPKYEIVVPLLAIAYLCYVFYEQSLSLFPWIAGAWCLAGLAAVLAAPGLARRIGERLTAELTREDVLS
ncbi:APC family permease [Nonomuraea pusilla]|uniref:Amino acid/polyamine/organocation transporter, APC superfamily (TC 2.A.3) n=1 Tax=Nonomuraea pusilla TaxID=46177 RepID=A0A1H7THK8_9ACTN|nr:APC family permease [Nonomuraea pusilla]SEL84340.1 amino acid/polyamine/organocation transporter, APC superfamily (TC 2.A.3) [Nonomuraea pusilla]